MSDIKKSKQKKSFAANIKSVGWDLSDWYRSIDDPEITKDKAKILVLVEKFNKKYKDKVNSKNITPLLLKSALNDIEEIWQRVYRYSIFASKLHSVDTKSSKIGKFYQASNEFSTEISTSLLWFDVKLRELDDKTAGIILKDPILADYRHYLEHDRVFKPFTLEEKEERILTKKDQTSSDAFVRLYDELAADQKYELKTGGQIKQMSYSEIGTIVNSHPDRNFRQKASQALTKGLQDNRKPYTFILNTLLHDSLIDDELRSYSYPQQNTFMSYEVKPETVQNLVDTATKNYHIPEKFYQSKSKLLGYKLHEWDRYSSIDPKLDVEYSWSEAKKLVLEAFAGFDTLFAEIAQKFFDNKWIDAQLRDGKRNGAYCSYGLPSRHPLVLMNFSGKIKDVMTLAHELGHGIHAYLSKNQSLLNYWPSTATAEIASVFAETLVFDLLYRNVSDPKIKKNLLADKIQDSFATIFRQIAFYLYETDIHTHRRDQGEISTEEFSGYFQKRLQAMFGKGLTLTEGHQYWWMPVMHFYHYNFYVFTYSFGETLTTALYARYKEQGKDFVGDYIKALKAGGSIDPYQITKMMGVDIDKPDFWQKGLDVIDGYVQEFKQLTS